MKSWKLRKSVPLLGLMVILGLGTPQSAFAIETTGYSLWGAVSPSFISSPSGDHRGVKIEGGIQFPSEPEEKQSIRVSTARIFDASIWDRYNFLLHAAYRIIPNLEAGILIGVEYIDSNRSAGTYLKPLVGAEILYTLKSFGTNSLSVVTAYEAAQGSTGSIALNGGPEDLSANIFSIGLLFSFSVLK